MLSRPGFITKCRRSRQFLIAKYLVNIEATGQFNDRDFTYSIVSLACISVMLQIHIESRNVPYSFDK